MTKEEQKLIAIFRKELTVARDKFIELRHRHLELHRDQATILHANGVVEGMCLAVEMAERFEMKLADD